MAENGTINNLQCNIHLINKIQSYSKSLVVPSAKHFPAASVLLKCSGFRVFDVGSTTSAEKDQSQNWHLCCFKQVITTCPTSMCTGWGSQNGLRYKQVENKVIRIGRGKNTTILCPGVCINKYTGKVDHTVFWKCSLRWVFGNSSSPL